MLLLPQASCPKKEMSRNSRTLDPISEDLLHCNVGVSSFEAVGTGGETCLVGRGGGRCVQSRWKARTAAFYTSRQDRVSACVLPRYLIIPLQSLMTAVGVPFKIVQ